MENKQPFTIVRMGPDGRLWSAVCQWSPEDGCWHGSISGSNLTVGSGAALGFEAPTRRAAAAEADARMVRLRTLWDRVDLLLALEFHQKRERIGPVGLPSLGARVQAMSRIASQLS